MQGRPFEQRRGLGKAGQSSLLIKISRARAGQDRAGPASLGKFRRRGQGKAREGRPFWENFESAAPGHVLLHGQFQENRDELKIVKTQTLKNCAKSKTRTLQTTPKTGFENKFPESIL